MAAVNIGAVTSLVDIRAVVVLATQLTTVALRAMVSTKFMQAARICIDGSFSDINECLTSPCNMTCQNTNGSYYCECPSPQFRLHPNGQDCLGDSTVWLYAPMAIWNVIVGLSDSRYR